VTELSYTVPSKGEALGTSDGKIKTALAQIKEVVKLPLSDANLASPNNSVYRLIFSSKQIANSELAAGTYLLQGSGAATPIASGANLGAAGELPYFDFAKADYEVASKTQKLRLRAQVACNATKPLIKFTFGLYPVTVAGAGTEFIPTFGTVVTSSTVEINEPAASTVTRAVNSDFTIPADGAYVLGFVTSAKLTANSNTRLSAQLQTRNV
jgi:hypothetical protein